MLMESLLYHDPKNLIMHSLLIYLKTKILSASLSKNKKKTCKFHQCYFDVVLSHTNNATIVLAFYFNLKKKKKSTNVNKTSYNQTTLVTAISSFFFF